MPVTAYHCACGCGAQLHRVGKHGPPPTYASPSCRKRAERRRAVERALVSAQLELSLIEPVFENRTPADVQVERALLEARAVAFAFARLATESRPELSWRCAQTSEAFLTALAANFGDEVAQ
jgi:hypothetical protein